MSIDKLKQTKNSFVSLKENAKSGGAISKVLNSAFVQTDIVQPLEMIGEFVANAVDCSKFLGMTKEQQGEIKKEVNAFDQPCKGYPDLGQFVGLGMLSLAGKLGPIFANVDLIKSNLQNLEKIAETEIPDAFKDKAMNIVQVSEKFGENFLKLFHCYKQVHDEYDHSHQFAPAWKEGFECAKGNMEEVGDLADAVMDAAFDFMFHLNDWAVKEYGAAEHQHGAEL